MNWTTRLFDGLSRTLRLPLFWQIFLPVLLVIGTAILAGRSFITQQQDGAVDAIVEHEEIDLKDEVEAALRQLTDVYAGLRTILEPLTDETGADVAVRLQQPLDDSAERREAVPCVYAAKVSLDDDSPSLTAAQPIDAWKDAETWRLDTPENSAGAVELLRSLRGSSGGRVVLSPPEHGLLKGIRTAPEANLSQIPTAIVWAAVTLDSSPDRDAQKSRSAVVAAFDVRGVMTHFFFSPRHISWMRTPLGNVHGRSAADTPAIFRAEQIEKWRAQATVEAQAKPGFRELIRCKDIVDCGANSGLGELWYHQSDIATDPAVLGIAPDVWRSLQSELCLPGEGISGASLELPRFRVSARSRERLHDLEAALADTIRQSSPSAKLRWSEPSLQLVGGTASRQSNGCVIEYVHYKPTESVVPSDHWDVAVGIFKDEVAADARREVSQEYGWAILAVMVGLAGTGVLLWFITESIRRIKDAANLIAGKAASNSADWLDELPVLPVDRQDEVGDLARAFSSMVGAIGFRDSALRDEHRRSQAILENAADGILTVDHNHAILTYNRAAERLFGWQHESPVGRKIEELVANPENVRLDELSPSESGVFGRRLSNIVAVRADGSYFPMDLTISQVPLENENIELHIVRDVTEREESTQRQRELLAELEAGKHELEERVAQRTQELAAAKDDVVRRNAELLRVNAIRAEGLRSIAHELVSPLSGIMSQASTLQRSSPPLTPEQSTKLKKIQRAGKHVVGVIEALRTMARCESGKIELVFARMSLKDCLQDVCDVLESTFEARKMSLVRCFADCDAQIVADESSLRQVFINLLSNACKYSPEGRSVEVYLDEEETHACVRVVDHGIGIPPDDVPHIFEDFRRATNANTQAVGLGLGLSIAQKLVQRHNGLMTVQSELGVGTTFVVRLPRNPSPASDDDGNSQSAVDFEPLWRGRRVLVIDHQEARVASLKDILGSLEAVFAGASNLEQAIAEAEILKPEIVFVADRRLDHPLSDVLAALRAMPGVKPPAIVLITALNEVYADKQCREQDCDTFVRVPLSRAAIVATIRAFLNSLSSSTSTIVD